jgi:hypothetical protein
MKPKQGLYQLPEKQTTPRGPKQDLPGRLYCEFRLHKLEKIVTGGKGKKKHSAHKKPSETRYICLHSFTSQSLLF